MWWRMRAGCAISAAADSAFPVAFAGILMFGGGDPRAAAMALLVAVIPAAVMAPVIAVLVRRLRGVGIVLSAATWLRAVCAAAAAVLFVSQTLWVLIPVLIGVLSGRAFSVAKSTAVPAVVTTGTELVGANASLSRFGMLGGAVGAVTAAAFVAAGVGMVALAVAAVLYTIAGAMFVAVGRRCAGVNADRHRSTALDQAVRSRIRVGRMSLVGVRAGIGMLVVGVTLGVAENEFAVGVLPGVGLSCSLGGFAGTMMARRIAQRCHGELRTLHAGGALTVVVVGGLAAGAAAGGHVFVGALMLGGAVLGGIGSIARAAFDALVQLEVPEPSRAGVFAVTDMCAQFGYAAGGAVMLFGFVPDAARFGALTAVVAAGLGSAAWTNRRSSGARREDHCVADHATAPGPVSPLVRR
jgi:hypothetical protein